MADRIDDSLLYERRYFDGERRAERWLRVAYNAHCRLAPFRKMRANCKAYAYGKQYERSLITYNGRTMTKEKYLEEKGIPALQTNILGKIKRVVQGQFRGNNTAPICNAVDPAEKEAAEVYSVLLRQNMKLNDRSEMDAREFEEFLISGLSVYKVLWAHREGKEDVFVDKINPNSVFFPYSLDYRLHDIQFCGMLHEYDFTRLSSLFAHSDHDLERLREIYQHCMDMEYVASQYSTDRRNDIENTSFFTPAEYGKCRVIELWTKERRKAWLCHDPLESEPYYVPYNQKRQLEQLNAQRLELNIKRNADGTPMTDASGRILHFMDPKRFEEENLIRYEWAIEAYWYYRYLSPDGYILEEGASPYWNGAESFHPFVFKPYPFIDGEIHPFISEVIPSQEYFNYYMVALDFYIRNAAKGVLKIDDQSLSDEMPIESIADQWMRSNGVILYTSKRGGKAPETAVASSIPGGFDYILQLSRSMVDDVSGVQPSLQGKGQGSESGVLYQAKATQASYSILDLIASYNSFLEDVAYKVVKVIKCFYTGKKEINIAGQTITYDMDTISDVDLEISISEDADGPVYRALTNQMLLTEADKGRIPFRVALEAGNFPNSSKIISILDKYEQQLQNAQSQTQQQAQPQLQAQPQPQSQLAS
jgi:hypothetical protein